MILKNNYSVPGWLVDMVIRVEESNPYEKNTFVVSGVRELGKTTSLIQFIRYLGSKQDPDVNGVRRLKFFMMRTAYREIRQLLESFEEWFDFETGYESVRKGNKFGFCAVDMRQAPKMVWCEQTPDLLGMIMGQPYNWDGTKTIVEIECYSYGHMGADAAMRGANKGSGMINECQTLPLEAFQVSRGTFGRPKGKVKYPCLLLDSNMPKASDTGYVWMKQLSRQDPELVEDENIHIVKMTPPYTFRRDPKGDFTLQGKLGFLEENPEFLTAYPHIHDYDSYKGYKLEGDDAVMRDMLGQFGLASSTNQIYHEFDDQKHLATVSPPDPDDYPDNIIIITLDFGFLPAVLFSYVDQGIPYCFHEIIIEDINFYQLLSTYIVPYLEEKLPYYYDNDQIVIVGDPTSGNRRSAISSATPINVLLGVTDIHGDEQGDAERFKFNAVPSPCGNNWKYRVEVSKQMLNRPHGIYFDNALSFLILMFEEYCEGAGGLKPLKKSGDTRHGSADSFQYLCAYLAHGGETHVDRSGPKKKRKKKARRGVRYV